MASRSDVVSLREMATGAGPFEPLSSSALTESKNGVVGGISQCGTPSRGDGKSLSEIAAAIQWAEKRIPTAAERDAICSDSLDTSQITIRKDHLYLLLRQSENSPWQDADPRCMKFDEAVDGQDRCSKYLFHPIPVQDEIFYKNYMTQLASYWHPHELKNPPNDFASWNMIPARYRELMIAITGFFVVGDTLISRVLHRFWKGAPCHAANASISAQIFMEVIHMDGYGMFASLIPDIAAKNRAFNQVNDLECVKAKAQFIEKWMDNDTVPRWQIYIAAAATEGIFFASLFAIIFCFRKTPYFNDFITMNTWIMNDETLHRNQDIQLALRVAKDDGHTIIPEVVHAIIKEAVAVEKLHIDYMLERPIENEDADRIMGMRPDQVLMYVHTLANQIAHYAGVLPVYDTPAFAPVCMEGVGNTVKEDFYTTSVSQYQHFQIKDKLALVKKWTTAPLPSSSQPPSVCSKRKSDVSPTELKNQPSEMSDKKSKKNGRIVGVNF